MGDWPVEFVGAEIGRAAAEIVVDRGKSRSRVDSGGAWLQPEIEVCGIIQPLRVAGGVRHRHLDEDVVIHQLAMAILPGCITVFLERLKAARDLLPLVIGGGSELLS